MPSIARCYEFIHTTLRASTMKSLYLLFAMNRTSEADRIRVGYIQSKGIDCITISESYVQDQGTHMSTDFRIHRGWRKVLRIVRALKSTSSVTILAFLDYFWLQSNYFSTRYGTDWYTYKAITLLLAGARYVYLPHAAEISGSLKHVPDNVTFNFQKTTPLSTATNRVQLPAYRGSHSVHLARLAKPNFIRFQMVHSFTFSVLYLIVCMCTPKRVLYASACRPCWCAHNFFAFTGSGDLYVF